MKQLLTFDDYQIIATRDKQYTSKKERVELFVEKEDRLVFLRGIVDLLPEDKINVIDNTYKQTIEDFQITSQEIKTILQPQSGFDLRKDQIKAVKKILALRWGTLQMATGAGKTEILSAILKSFKLKLGYFPKTLLIEPTLHLVESTKDRFREYNIPATMYTDHRNIDESEVLITHPMSLNNDLLENPDLLSGVKVVMFDESHHGSADTWKRLIYCLENIEFSIGTSASVVEDVTEDFAFMEYDEVLALGCTGQVVLNLPASYYIKKGILAEPVIMRIDNPANEDVDVHNDWSGELYPKKINSEARNSRSVEMASFFASYDRKVLILVDRKAHARSILQKLAYRGDGDITRISFGSDVKERFDLDKDEPVTIDEDVLSKFKKSEVKILIATPHVDEGFDVPNLDVGILGGGGKSKRKVIQRLGRMLRKTKVGKYAYIVDFTDYKDDILRKHSLSRRNLYVEEIGVTDDKLLDGLSIEEAKKNFLDFENLE